MALTPSTIGLERPSLEKGIGDQTVRTVIPPVWVALRNFRLRLGVGRRWGPREGVPLLIRQAEFRGQSGRLQKLAKLRLTVALTSQQESRKQRRPVRRWLAIPPLQGRARH